MESKTGSLREKSGIASKQYPVVRTKETSTEEAGSVNHRTQSRMATIKNDDERLLARIGYRQVSYGYTCNSVCIFFQFFCIPEY